MPLLSPPALQNSCVLLHAAPSSLMCAGYVLSAMSVCPGTHMQLFGSLMGVAMGGDGELNWT